jgi:hypothetical protein
MAVCEKIMVIRHAEKPDKQAGMSGISKVGEPDKDDLTVRGWQRAGALVRFFNPFASCRHSARNFSPRRDLRGPANRR